MQTAQRRDLATLLFVLGLFAILFIVTVALGSPSPR